MHNRKISTPNLPLQKFKNAIVAQKALHRNLEIFLKNGVCKNWEKVANLPESANKGSVSPKNALFFLFDLIIHIESYIRFFEKPF